MLVSATRGRLRASGRYLIELGSSLEPVEAVQDRLLSLLGMLLPVLVACAAGGGYLLVQRALRPVERMSQTAAQISVQDLDARLPVRADRRCAAASCRSRSITCSGGCASRCRPRAAFSPTPRTSCARR